jgi:hypothetical protein
MGGIFFLFWGGKLNDKKNYKKKMPKALDGCRLIFCHATTNQKYAGMTEGGWDRPRNRARRLVERDGKRRATKTMTMSTARMATSLMTTANVPLASTVSASSLTRATTSTAPA